MSWQNLVPGVAMTCFLISLSLSAAARLLLADLSTECALSPLSLPSLSELCDADLNSPVCSLCCKSRTAAFPLESRRAVPRLVKQGKKKLGLHSSSPATLFNPFFFTPHLTALEHRGPGPCRLTPSRRASQPQDWLNSLSDRAQNPHRALPH